MQPTFFIYLCWAFLCAFLCVDWRQLLSVSRRDKHSPLPSPSCHWWTLCGELRPTSREVVVCQSASEFSITSLLHTNPARSNPGNLKPPEEYNTPRPNCAVKVGGPVRLVTEGQIACMRPPGRGPLCSVQHRQQTRYRVHPPSLLHLSASRRAHQFPCCHSRGY